MTTLRVTMLIVALLSAAGCGSGQSSAGAVSTSGPATPSAGAIGVSPASVNAGGAAFTLTVVGSGFTANSQTRWNGSPRAATYISTTEVQAAISPSDIALPGTASVQVASSASASSTQAGRVAILGPMPAMVRFVAPNGSDANPGSINQPFQTIQKCATSAASGSTCAIRGGTYGETVTPNSGLVITSYDGEPVVVDGSKAVTGWTPYQGSIYRAAITLASDDTNQIFAGGQMMTEARWPNGDDLYHVNWATAGTGTTSSLLVDPNLPSIDWTGATIHFWSGSDPWSGQTATVTQSQTGQLAFTVDGTSFPPSIQPEAGGYYYVFGALGALDAQDEWFYDRAAAMLYLWAPGGADPGTLDVRAKVRQHAFDLSGKSNVTIRNLTLFAASITMDAASSHNTLDGITASFVSQFSKLPDSGGIATSSWFAHDADSGIVIDGTGNVLRNSTVTNSSGNGVTLLGSNNTVQNNLIHHVDSIGNYCAGIQISGNGQTIRNNTIHATGRAAIYPGTGSTSNSDIGFNNLFNAMMLTRDGGVIYASGTASVGSSIHDNWIHDTQSLYPGPADNLALAGVYLDGNSNGWLVTQNVLWNNEFQNIAVHGAGSQSAQPPNDNTVSSNSIPDANPTGYIWLFDIPDCGTTQATDNLVAVPLTQTNANCGASDNGLAAPGATDMAAGPQVGCGFAGCSSAGPPAISGALVAASIATQPVSVTISVGQPATFQVSGAGSAPLSYQWSRNGSPIGGATAAAYTIPSAATGDSGSVFMVQVANAVGSANSAAATLTVRP